MKFIYDHPLIVALVGYVVGASIVSYVSDKVKVRVLARTVTDDLDKQWQAIVARRAALEATETPDATA